jgi:hypothetical protein
MHYPVVISLGELNYSTELDGVIGGTFEFQFTDNVQYNFGIDYTFDVFQANRVLEYSEPTKIGLMQNHFDLFSKLRFIDIPELQMKIQGGFTTYKYSKGTANRNYNGFNAGTGFSYTASEQLYIFTNYSYTNTVLKSNEGYDQDKETYHVLRIGLGFNF